MKKFWKDATERAIKTAAQTALAAIGTTALIQEVSWKVVISTVALATLMSFLTSVASKQIGNADSASLVANKKKEGENIDGE